MKRAIRAILHKLGYLEQARHVRDFLTYKLTKERDQLLISIHSRKVRLAHFDTYTHTWLSRHKDNYHGLYEPSLSLLFQELSRDMKGFLDVGCQLGYFSILHSVLPQNVSYAVELSPPNFDSLSKILKQVHYDGVIHTFNVGFSSSRGTFQFPKTNYQSSMFGFAYPFDEDATGGMSVEIKTLDEFCSEQNFSPDFIKIDVEGAEFEVLKGATRQISAHHPVLLIELHKNELDVISDATPQDVVDLLTTAGYEPFVFEDLRSPFPTPLAPWSNDNKSSNSFAVFLPEQRAQLLDRFNHQVEIITHARTANPEANSGQAASAKSL